MIATRLFYYVRDGAIAQPQSRAVLANGNVVTKNPFPRPNVVHSFTVPAEATDDELADLGVYRLWIAPAGDPPGPDFVQEHGDPAVEMTHIVRRDYWRPMTDEERERSWQDHWEERREQLARMHAEKTLDNPPAQHLSVLADRVQQLEERLAALEILERR